MGYNLTFQSELPALSSLVTQISYILYIKAIDPNHVHSIDSHFLKGEKNCKSLLSTLLAYIFI